MRTGNEIRSDFIAFFEEAAHTHVPSSAVVPFDDPTLLFTNAGMNQFKDVFLGSGSRPYTRAANSQKCIRAGGKHNDLDDVGHDTYHHTFFEMLGNWSFGDYFKAEAIDMAWTLLTRRWGLDKSRLHVTVFEGGDGVERDEEAARLWRERTDIDPEHIHYFGKKDNFWEMGETGPCGPCSEIHIDRTPDRSGGKLVNADDPRVMEIWNLVFIQYNRDATKTLTPLPDQHVDTGMGLERITAVMQDKSSNYDTDIFTPIFDAIRSVTGAPAYGGRLEGGAAEPAVMVDVAYRVVADHLRCLTFAIADGADLSNEGRGYVLRRILRRAVRYGRQYLGTQHPFLHRLVPALAASMGGAFPELRSNPKAIAAVLEDEEKSFGRTYERGLGLFQEAAATAVAQGSGITAETAFGLHSTFGFPIDLTMIMARERGLDVDAAGYETLMEKDRQQARDARSGAADFDLNIATTLPPTDDDAKYAGSTLEATVLGYVRDGRFVADRPVPADDTVALLLDRTCFYGEQGGQVGDAGVISGPDGEFVVDTTLRHGETVLHIGHLRGGQVSAGGVVTARLHGERRHAIMQNHTATHVLNWALREVLGPHVDQRGSLVDEHKTRFDFAHGEAVGAEQLAAIEQRVNDQIAQRLAVHTAVVEQGAARRITTLRAVFGEKYPDTVRVVAIGETVDALLAMPDEPAWMGRSVEFCGGTHLANTADIERFCLIEESAVARGVRRVIGLSGEAAQHCVLLAGELQRELERLNAADDGTVAADLPALGQRVNTAAIPTVVKQRQRAMVKTLAERARQHAKSEGQAGARAVRDRAEDLLKSAGDVGGSRVIVGEVPSAGPEQIREALDYLRTAAGSAGILLGSPAGDKVLLLAAMTDDLVGRGLKAGDLIRAVAPLVGGGGGGKPQLAQAGGKDPAGLPAALDMARAWITERLQG